MSQQPVEQHMPPTGRSHRRQGHPELVCRTPAVFHTPLLHGAVQCPAHAAWLDVPPAVRCATVDAVAIRPGMHTT